MSVYRILIVEQNEKDALTLCRIIRNMGYEIAGIADSASEAINLTSGSRPDLIIMNYHLPRLRDGIFASEQIHLIRKIPIIYVNEDLDHEAPTLTQKSGITGYITKPFQEKDIRIALKIALYKYENDCLIQESRTWLETVLQSIGEGIIATNKSGEICLINPTAKNILGYYSVQPGDILSEMLMLYRNSDNSLVSIPEKVDSIIQFSHFDNLLYIKRPDGSTAFVDGNIAPINDLNNECLGLVFNIRDISEIIKTKEIISQAFNQIEENLEKFALLNDQIRNPLSIIVAILDLDDSDLITKIMPYVMEIDELINQLDNGYIVSSKVRTFLKKHHEIS